MEAAGSAQPRLQRAPEARRRVEPGHDLLGEQLHRAPAERLVLPVHAGIQQRAEVAGRLAEREQLLDDAVDGAGDHELVRDALGRDRRVGLVLIQLEEVRAAAGGDELAQQLLEVEVVRPLGGLAVALRGASRRRRRRCTWRRASRPDRPSRRRPRSPRRSAASARRPTPAAGSSPRSASSRAWPLRSTPSRMRRDGGHDDRRMRLLERLEDRALADLGDHRLGGRDLEVLALEVVRPVALPDLEHHVDRLEEDRVAVLLVVAEHLGVRHQPARADAHDEPPLEHVIEHRDLRRDVGRVRVRHVERAGAERDLRRGVRDAREEHHRGGDVLGEVGDVLADEGLLEAEAIGQQDRLAVLGQRLPGVATRRVQRHHEHAQLHRRQAGCPDGIRRHEWAAGVRWDRPGVAGAAAHALQDAGRSPAYDGCIAATLSGTEQDCGRDGLAADDRVGRAGVRRGPPRHLRRDRPHAEPDRDAVPLRRGLELGPTPTPRIR